MYVHPLYFTLQSSSSMKCIKAKYDLLTDLSEPISTILTPIEVAGRTCYKSEDKITEYSCIQFCKMIISRGHTAMLEHSQLSVRFTVDRAIANELVRHRHTAFAQESSRYVNYSKDKFGNEIRVVEPDEFKHGTVAYGLWYDSCKYSELAYMDLLKEGVKPEFARNVLPLSTATEIVCTASIREWISIFTLRTTAFAHPQMRSIMRSLLDELKQKVPVLFDSISYEVTD